jgi:hypothetical protein
MGLLTADLNVSFTGGTADTTTVTKVTSSIHLAFNGYNTP